VPVGVKEGRTFVPGPGDGGFLVQRVRDGDMAAFTALYRDNVGAVMRAVRDNVQDPETVAEVTQEVFARALERLDSLRDPARFRPWLLSIARHAAIDHRRTRKHVAGSLDDAPDEPADTGRGPADVAELNELARLVRGGVAGLSRRDATALTLVTQFGLRPPEVAVALGVSVGAAKVILCRARRRLRDALTQEGHEIELYAGVC
jgi:RNA polymerase sigma factor (sigma-70 family)